MKDAPERSDEEILARRAQWQRWATTGQRIGYLLYLVAIITFFVAFADGFNNGYVRIIVGAMVIGSAFLGPAILAGYAVKAAVRDDREHGRDDQTH